MQPLQLCKQDMVTMFSSECARRGGDKLLPSDRR